MAGVGNFSIEDPEAGALQSVIGASQNGMRRVGTFGASGMTISVQNLSFSVKSNTDKKATAFLLKDVTAFFSPKRMSALMGPSGSGKTTLLDLLAGRKTTGRTDGVINFAGQAPTRQFLRRYTGYVEQFDTLLPVLTVREMLTYTAELKRPQAEPLASKKAAVEALLGKLALRECAEVPIGSAMAKGISGGQAKRTNIGIALITSPRVLFLDEPTSGLDSFTANEVMRVVHGLLGEGVTIVATIHSPTATAFSLFDDLLMLVRGRTVYFGPRGGAVDYVRSNLKLDCAPVASALADMASEPVVNDAEWLVDLFTQADRQSVAATFADTYAASALSQSNTDAVASLCSERHVLPELVQQELSVRSATVTSWWWGLITLLKYRTSRNYRDPAFLGPRVMDKLFMGLLITTLYLGIGSKFSPTNYINMAAVLFMWVTLPAFGAAAYVPAIVMERSLFVRERSDGLYRVVTYLLAKMVEELVLAGVASLGISAMVFYSVQLQGNFLLFWLAYFMVLSNGIVLAYFVAGLSPNMDVANAALPAYIGSSLFFAGFLFTFDTIPVWWAWYSRVDFLRYAWTACMVNQFEAHNSLWLGGKTVLGYYGIESANKWESWAVLFAFFAAFSTGAWATLTFRKYQQR